MAEGSKCTDWLMGVGLVAFPSGFGDHVEEVLDALVKSALGALDADLLAPLAGLDVDALAHEGGAGPVDHVGDVEGADGAVDVKLLGDEDGAAGLDAGAGDLGDVDAADLGGELVAVEVEHGRHVAAVFVGPVEGRARDVVKEHVAKKVGVVARAGGFGGGALGGGGAVAGGRRGGCVGGGRELGRQIAQVVGERRLGRVAERRRRSKPTRSSSGRSGSH